MGPHDETQAQHPRDSEDIPPPRKDPDRRGLALRRGRRSGVYDGMSGARPTGRAATTDGKITTAAARSPSARRSSNLTQLQGRPHGVVDIT